MYPEFGDGIVVLTREQYRALTILRGYEFNYDGRVQVAEGKVNLGR